MLARISAYGSSRQGAGIWISERAPGSALPSADDRSAYRAGDHVRTAPQTDPGLGDLSSPVRDVRTAQLMCACDRCLDVFRRDVSCGPQRIIGGINNLFFGCHIKSGHIYGPFSHTWLPQDTSSQISAHPRFLCVCEYKTTSQWLKYVYHIRTTSEFLQCTIPSCGYVIFQHRCCYRVTIFCALAQKQGVKPVEITILPHMRQFRAKLRSSSGPAPLTLSKNHTS